MENEDFNATSAPAADASAGAENTLDGMELPLAPVTAGFNARFIAYVIDSLPFLFAAYWSLNAAVKNGVIVYTPGNEIKWKIMWAAAYVVYETLLTCRGRATVGKLIMGLRVRTKEGGDLSFGRALLRALAYFLSSVTLNLGYLLALFTPKKRALHDYIAGTRVISLKERGDLANTLILALSWGLMAIFVGSWLSQTVLRMTPSEKRQIFAAYRTVSKLGKLEQIYNKKEGHYTNDLKSLADLTGNVNAVRAELYRTIDPATLVISSNGRDYEIKAKARNWRKTEVQVSSLPKPAP